MRILNNARKDAGFGSDRVIVTYIQPGMWLTFLVNFNDLIRSETLADVLGPGSDGGAFGRSDMIGGSTVVLNLSKV